ncbi:hypothetical protein [Peribacillus alkalitolerans]|uniref:hypothetical protein n=1 Tax=Peribacillus alkalitolerans TaxID=1550385 RepID=UPI0013D8975A|nr:hypothetical protein [Peribacillus alkalitolerans]
MITNYIANMEVLQPLTELLPVHEGYSDVVISFNLIKPQDEAFLQIDRDLILGVDTKSSDITERASDITELRLFITKLFLFITE